MVVISLSSLLPSFLSSCGARWLKRNTLSLCSPLISNFTHLSLRHSNVCSLSLPSKINHHIEIQLSDHHVTNASYFPTIAFSWVDVIKSLNKSTGVFPLERLIIENSLEFGGWPLRKNAQKRDGTSFGFFRSRVVSSSIITDRPTSIVSSMLQNFIIRKLPQSVVFFTSNIPIPVIGLTRSMVQLQSLSITLFFFYFPKQP